MAAGQSVEVSIEHRFRSAGETRIRFEIDADGLPLDDVRYLALQVRDRLEVLIVEPGAGADTGSAGELIYRALWPEMPQEAQAPRTILRPVRAASLLERDIDSADAIILAGGLRLDALGVERLERRLERRAGGLIVFAGPDADAESWARLLFRGGRGALPARLVERDLAAAAPFHPAEIDTGHPALDIFRDPAEGDLSRAEVRAYWRTDSLASEAAALARIDRTSSPWIIAAAYGRGRVVLCTSLVSEPDSDLYRTPLIVPLLHRLVRFAAAPAAAEAQRHAGEEILLEISPGAAPAGGEVQLPGGAVRPLELIERDGRWTASAGRAARPGFYAVEIEAPAGGASEGAAPGAEASAAARTSAGATEHLLAVNFPEGESRMERYGREEIDAIGEASEIKAASDLSAILSRRRIARSDVEHWPYLVGIALLCLLAELCLLRGFSGGYRPAGDASAGQSDEAGAEQPSDASAAQRGDRGDRGGPTRLEPRGDAAAAQDAPARSGPAPEEAP
ncbi:MAG: hypothetical protein JXA90_09960 [Planctomycetes bacterium]|nr:hypothetical protein [Planctomycetota bacterium]